jgi:DNA repair protein RadC
MVHNRASGDPTRSQADIRMTKEIVAVAQPLGISVHDHTSSWAGMGMRAHLMLRVIACANIPLP